MHVILGNVSSIIQPHCQLAPLILTLTPQILFSVPNTLIKILCESLSIIYLKTVLKNNYRISQRAVITQKQGLPVMYIVFQLLCACEEFSHGSHCCKDNCQHKQVLAIHV